MLRSCRRLRKPAPTPLIFEPLEDRRLLTAGALDPTFGTGGLATTSFLAHVLGSAHAITIQPDGKSVVAGVAAGSGDPYFSAARYNADGNRTQL